MARKKDFYLKFDYKDFLSDPKVRDCEPETVGVYIMVICVLCDMENKGVFPMKEKYSKDLSEVLLKQIDKQIEQQTGKQTDKHVLNVCLKFACAFRSLLPYSETVICMAFYELLSAEILYVDGNNLCQKRMIRDAEISKMRSSSGKKGGLASVKKQKKATKNNAESFAKDLLEQNVKQKPNYNYISINTSNRDIQEKEKEKEGIGNVGGVQGDENLGEGEKGKTTEKKLPPQNLNFNLHDQKKKSTKTLTLDAGDVQLLANFGENVRVEWLAWRQYSLDVHNKKTDNIQVKQQQLEKLVMFSKGDEDLAVKIIKNSMANVWANLQPISVSKFPKNGQAKPPISDIDQQIAAETDLEKKVELQRKKYALP